MAYGKDDFIQMGDLGTEALEILCSDHFVKFSNK